MKLQWLALFALLFALVVAIFAVINVDPVEVNYLFGTMSTPLILVILAATLLGGLIVFLFAFTRQFRLQRRLKQLEAQVLALSGGTADLESRREADKRSGDGDGGAMYPYVADSRYDDEQELELEGYEVGNIDTGGSGAGGSGTGGGGAGGSGTGGSSSADAGVGAGTDAGTGATGGKGMFGWFGKGGGKDADGSSGGASGIGKGSSGGASVPGKGSSAGKHEASDGSTGSSDSSAGGGSGGDGGGGGGGD